MQIILGIDIGGSGIKGALINIKKGQLVGARLKIPTPSISSPENLVIVIKDLVNHFNWSGIIGCTFPGVIINQVIKTSANLNKECINTNLSNLITKATKCPTWMLNDADAAAHAEIAFGSAKNFNGSGMMITIGTGLGSALFYNKILFPNTELGHLLMNGTKAEITASAAAIVRESLSWEIWGNRFNSYLQYVHSLFWPQLIILGGGISRNFDQFQHFLNIPTKIIPAKFQNYAGIIGAALAADLALKPIIKR